MAAEHESERAHGRGDQPAALPPAGADARARPRARRRLLLPLEADLQPTSRTDRAANRRAQQGFPGRARGRDAARERLPRAPGQPRAGAGRPGQRRRVLLPAPARRRGLRRRRHARRRDHRPRPAARLGRPRRTRSCSLGFAGSTFRFAGPAGRRHQRRRAGRAAGRDELPGAGGAAPGRARRRRAEVVRLDGAVESAVRSASPT